MLAGLGFPTTDSSAVTILAAGSSCLIQETSRNLIECLTSNATPSEEPFAGSQGVRRQLWKTKKFTTEPGQALSIPESVAELSEVLPSFDVGFDDNAEPFVQTLTSILTLPISSSGDPAVSYATLPEKRTAHWLYSSICILPSHDIEFRRLRCTIESKNMTAMKVSFGHIVENRHLRRKMAS